MENIESLYNEKLLKKTVEVKVKVKKAAKPKKKIEEEDLLEYYEATVVDGIKTYTGTSTQKKKEIKRHIRFLQSVIFENPLTKLESSVLSIEGKLTNISFNEEIEVPFCKIPERRFEKITKITCNFCEMYVFPNIYNPPILYNMVRAVKALPADKIIIGCYCQPPLDTIGVYTMLANIKEDIAIGIFNTYITRLEKSKASKSKNKKIIKQFRNFLNFKITEKETITEIQNNMDLMMTKKDRVICYKYLESLIDIIKVFTIYARNCKCWKPQQHISIFSAPLKEKKNPEEKEKRKKQGTGFCFNSQVSFDIYNDNNVNTSKIKLFRTGKVQVPGVKCSNMRDVFMPLRLFIEFWKNYEPNKPEPKIQYLLSDMRNYKCKISNEIYKVQLNMLEDCLMFEKELPISPLSQLSCLKFLTILNLPNKLNLDIFKYYGYSFYNIAEINYNPDSYPGLLVKFNRPIPSKENKKMTIKMLASGKINFDGGNSEIEVYEMYYWVQFILLKYWDEIIFDPKKNVINISDDDEYDSIYDSE